MKKSLTILMVFLAFLVYAQKKTTTTSADPRFQGLETELQKVLMDWKGAGFAVAVVEKNKIVYAKGFGVKSIYSKEPINPHTLFAIGSCTKAFTATLVGQLVADGKVSYDEPVRNYLPELRFYNNDMNNLITLRDMMSHKTGLPRHDLSWYFNQSENRDSLLQRIKYMEPTFRPKEKYQYNNFMFFAQGALTEKYTRQSWEKNMQEKLFKPLGMKRSNMPYTAVKNDTNLAAPHVYRTDSTLRLVPHYNIGGMGPAGAVYSSVVEMSNWVQAWIYGGKYKGVQVIPAIHYKEAIAAQVPSGSGVPDVAHPDISGANYGFGWSLASYRGHYRVEHGGAIDGFIASTSFFPTDSIGIIILSNQSSRQIPTIVRNIISDRMLKLPVAEWNKELLTLAAKAKKETDSARAKAVEVRHSKRFTHQLQEYEGLYTHPGYGTMDVFVQNDSLFMRTKVNTLWLMNWHYDVFYPFEVLANEKIDTAEKGNLSLRFNTAINGDIESMNAFGFEVPSIELVFKKTPKAKQLSTTELEAYIGEYDLSGTLTRVYIANKNTLYVEVPGQSPYELTFVGDHKFVFKSVQGFAVQFDKNTGEKASAITFLQPHGNFKAPRKN